MLNKTETNLIGIDLEFAEEVQKGLSASKKCLPTRYIYDERGDALFQQIMELPEYYLTRSEMEILQRYKSAIATYLKSLGRFKLVELGAGDGSKTKVLVQELLRQGADFEYVPIDISANVLEQVSLSMKSQFPQLTIEAKEADYFAALHELKAEGEPIALLFLGSNLGNFSKPEIQGLVKKIYDSLSMGDLLFLGVDMVKDPASILAAYNDAQGITAEFNKNLLVRINEELDGRFDIDQFYFFPSYDPGHGGVNSYLVSKLDQEVYIGALDETYAFVKGEAIFTEISQKFTEGHLAELCLHNGLRQLAYWSDSKANFRSCLWKKQA